MDSFIQNYHHKGKSEAYIKSRISFLISVFAKFNITSQYKDISSASKIKLRIIENAKGLKTHENWTPAVWIK